MKPFLRLLVILIMGNAYAQSNLPACESSDISKWNDCFGTVTITTGTKYSGSFKDGKYHGLGIYTYPNGRKDVGEFMNGKLNGKGTIKFSNGEKYIGEFKDDKYHGLGTLYTVNDSIIQQGIWAYDKFIRYQPVQ